MPVFFGSSVSIQYYGFKLLLLLPIDNEGSNTTRGPSVVFPSIQKKPSVANSYPNSSFAYEYGRNKFGVEVRENYSILDNY